MRTYAERYEFLRERMAAEEMSVQEVKERVQVALTLALTNARADGDTRHTILHAQFAADATAWIARQLNPQEVKA